MFAVFEFYPFGLSIGPLVLFLRPAMARRFFFLPVSVLWRVFPLVGSYLDCRLFPPAILLTAPNILDLSLQETAPPAFLRVTKASAFYLADCSATQQKETMRKDHFVWSRLLFSRGLVQSTTFRAEREKRAHSESESWGRGSLSCSSHPIFYSFDAVWEAPRLTFFA